LQIFRRISTIPFAVRFSANQRMLSLRYFEDFEVGEESTPPEYEVTRDGIIAYASAWDPQPFHVDEEIAAGSIFGGLTAASSHLYAVCARLAHEHSIKTAMLAALGIEKMRFPNPARPGDRLRLESRCLKKRASRSKPDRGIVTTLATLLNHRDEPVLTMKVVCMVARRRAG
jgi:acyl dehydratase